jgi:hypothetical protein
MEFLTAEEGEVMFTVLDRRCYHESGQAASVLAVGGRLLSVFIASQGLVEADRVGVGADTETVIHLAGPLAVERVTGSWPVAGTRGDDAGIARCF